jgi:hypothetical protein
MNFDYDFERKCEERVASLKKLTSENVINVAVRLGNLPWKWVAVIDLFENEQEMRKFADISKDGNYHLSCAIRADLSSSFMADESSECGDATAWGAPCKLLVSPHWHKFNFCYDSRRYDHDWKLFFVPLGFALDVLEWKEKFWVAGRRPFPRGIWQEPRDVRDDALFSCLDGSQWFVVYPPEQSE